MTFDEWWTSCKDDLPQEANAYTAARMAWAYAQAYCPRPEAKAECICPKCGIRHGGNADGGF